VPYTDTLTAEQLLQPADALASMFKAAGAKPGDTIIGTATLASRPPRCCSPRGPLGFTVLLYDGSFEDWSRQADYPVDNPSKK
jgi:3-mercaptopyruvate sulfurtransferase SseA